MWLEGSISRSSLQFHFLQTLEHRTDVPETVASGWAGFMLVQLWGPEGSRGSDFGSTGRAGLTMVSAAPANPVCLFLEGLL
uniref:Uncharacterized protein n=1 Tax=Taeniopygia guttata TaxID=59729 RepID=A0A674H6R1_TAEGU